MPIRPDSGLPPAPDPADLQRVLGEAEAEEMERASGVRRRAPGGRGVWPLVAFLAVAGVAVTLWNVRALEPDARPLPAKRQRAELAGMLYVLAAQVEATKERTGAYPATLDAVAPPLDGVVYRREAEGYVLEATAGGVTLSYRSGDDPAVQIGRASCRERV